MLSIFVNCCDELLLKGIGALFVSVLGSYLIAGKFIKKMQVLKFGQMVRDDGPKQHYSKQGTPTLGGVIIFIGFALGSLFFLDTFNMKMLLIILTIFGSVFLGFCDDYLKIVRKNSRGLSARKKLLGQLLLAFFVTSVLFEMKIMTTVFNIPFFNISIDIGRFYIPFGILYITGFSNAVNLSDGLDGLAIGLFIIIIVSLIVVLGMKHLPLASIDEGKDLINIIVLLFSLLGGALVFLFYNFYPAKIFMGDVGSLALGSAIGIIGLTTKTEMLLLGLGIVYVMEIFSVIIQVGSFKTFRRRIFKMAPLHHHFELSGMSELEVTLRFWLIGLVASLLLLFCSFFTM